MLGIRKNKKGGEKAVGKKGGRNKVREKKARKKKVRKKEVRKKKGIGKGGRKISLNVKKLVTYLLLCSLVLFFLYSLIILSGVRTRDILSENMSSHKFLSSEDTDLEKTIFVFESNTGTQRGISDVYVLLNNEKKENSMVLYIPGSLYFIGLEDDFGRSIPISSLRYAGDFLQEDRGVEYALWQLNGILGFKPDNYVWITTEAYDIINDVYGSTSDVKDRYKEDYTVQRGDSLTNAFLRLHTMSSQYSLLKSVFNVSDVKGMDGEIFSNLSFFAAMGKVKSYQRTVRNSETFVMDLSSPRYSSEQFSEHGGSIRTLDTTEYDKTLRRNYLSIIDRDLERERVRIEVYNGSQATGIAGIYARRILNNGCDVVRFGNAPESLEKTKVYVSDEKEFRNSFNIVQEVLFGRFQILEQRPSFMTTGDIVILLGEDILQLEMF